MAQKIPPCPKYVPIPKGYRRALAKEITPVVQRAAVRALQQALPIGKLQATEVNGKVYAFQTEWHYDDHVTKPGKPIWHPGISTLVPTVQPKASSILASQSVRDAQFIQQSRMTGEENVDNTSEIGGEGFLRRFIRSLFNPPKIAPLPPKPAPTAVQTAASKKAQEELAQSLLVLGSQVRGDDEDSLGDDEDSFDDDDEYDAVHGADFGDEMGDEDSYGYDEFGFDEFGGRKKKKGKVKAKGKVNVKAKGSIKFKGKVKAKAKRKPAPRSKARSASRPAPRPVVRPAAKPAARPAPRPTPFSPVAITPEEPIEEPVFEEPIAEALEPDYSEQENALEAYVMPAEETPETADEGSDSYDPSAIGNEYNICG